MFAKPLPLLMLGLLSCTTTSSPDVATAPETRRPGWSLVWADEFDRDGLPDPDRWTYEEGLIRNNELQYYTVRRPENARVEGGSLVIEARKEAYREAAYTSASLTTKTTASWRYGRVEVRARLPTGRGMWPAIWMLGTNVEEVGWPRCGEIDIMENVGFDPDRIHANVHTQAFNHVRGTQKGASVEVPRPHADFHVYAIEWFPDRIDFFVDDRKYFSFANSGQGVDEWPFDQPHYLIINAAIGGGWGGQQGVDDSIFPQRYAIDYVRVYEQTQISGFNAKDAKSAKTKDRGSTRQLSERNPALSSSRASRASR